MKKLCICIFCIACAVMIFMSASVAEKSGEYNGLQWDISNNGTLKIDGNGRIPSIAPWSDYRNEIKCLVLGKQITGIDPDAFYFYTNLKSVTIEFDTNIEEYALEMMPFLSCNKLSEVILTNSNSRFFPNWFESHITSVSFPNSSSNYSFKNNMLLNQKGDYLVYVFGNTEGEFTVSQEITTIGRFAFSCSNYTKIHLHDTITTIEQGAFYHCLKLKELTIPSSVQCISGYFLDGCKQLKSVVFLGDRIDFKGETGLFQGCSALESITLPKCNDLGGYTFNNCVNLKRVVLSEGTKTIGEYAFQNCPKLEYIYIPKSVNSIAASSFQNNKALKTTIYCISGSYAEDYAKTWGIKCTTVNPASPNTRSVIITVGCNIRELPTYEAKPIKWAVEGETFVLLEDCGEWFKVETQDGKIGYVPANRSNIQ